MRRLCVLLILMTSTILLAGAKKRPHDPWVFRCVLDKHPRMVVIALDESLWVAYDATTCSLYKAWRGDVNLQGAVYTTEHGPQPTVRGETILEPPTASAWSIQYAGKPIDFKPTWKGYRIQNDQVTLLYELQTAQGKSISIEEQVDVDEQQPADKPTSLRLVRTFHTQSVPTDTVVEIAVPRQTAAADVDSPRLVVDGKEPAATDAKAAVQRVGLKSNDRTTVATTLALPGSSKSKAQAKASNERGDGQ